MITSVFKKSTPLNFSLVVILMLVFFLLFQFQDVSWMNSVFSALGKLGLFLILLASVFLTNFISNKNGMSKDSAYLIFFYFLYLLFFPSLFDDTNLLFSNFFIVLALRRLISLQTLKASKEKIFDASLWIFLATLFHFWSILFIILVFISIIFHVYNDYRNWLLPFIALFVAATIFLLSSILLKIDALEYINRSVKMDFEISYFTNTYQNIAFSIYTTIALFFMFSIFATLSNRPLVLHAAYKKVIASFIIAFLVFIVSSHKSNDLLVFTIAPLAILTTSHIEMKQPKLNQELVLGVLILCSLFAFFSQL